MNIYRRRKSGYEISIDHYSNVFKIATISIQVIKKLSGNSSENGVKVNDMLKYQLQHEDYWMRTLSTVYPYDINGIYE